MFFVPKIIRYNVVDSVVDEQLYIAEKDSNYISSIILSVSSSKFSRYSASFRLLKNLDSDEFSQIFSYISSIHNSNYVECINKDILVLKDEVLYLKCDQIVTVYLRLTIMELVEEIDTL